jgi:TonB-dependent starch-binding outer membrane protein SusC
MQRIKQILIVLLLPVITHSQVLITRGRVVNEKMDPLPGATITIKGGGGVHITDQRGEFMVHNLTATDTLMIFNSEYQPREVPAQEAFITIVLQHLAGQLDEVIVYTGYQQLKRVRATGSFESISNKLLNQQVSTGILERLEGVSSLYADHNSLRPPLLLRGPSSILGDQSPLIVVDNFPYEGKIENINPNEVESITFLKDAAAASVWGARAGNGVIVITTRKGNFQQPLKIETNNSFTITSRPGLGYLQSISTADFIDVEQFLFSKKFRFSDTANVYRPAFSPVYEILFKKQKGEISSAEADHQLSILRARSLEEEVAPELYTPAIGQQYSIGLRGGSTNTHYLFSAGYNRDEDALKALSRRINLRSEIVFRPIKKVEVSTGLLYTQTSHQSGKPGFDVLRPNLYPYSQLSDAHGNALPLTVNIREPYIDTAGGGYLLNWHYYPLDDYSHQITKIQTQDIVVNAGLHYQVIPAVALDVKYQYEQQVTGTDYLQDEQSYNTRDLINRFTQLNRTTGEVKYNIPVGSILDKASTTLEAQDFRVQLSIDKKIGAHRFNAIAGSEWRQVHTTSEGYRLYGYNEDVLTTGVVDYVNPTPTFITGAQDYIPQNNSMSDLLNRFISFYGNGAYTYKERYTISGSARRDASNLFGVQTNEKWQPLWSTGVSWLMSSERFFKSKLLSYLKLKMTYGYSGNTDQSRSAVTTIAYTGVPASNTNFTYAGVRQFMNPDLRWEKTGMFNLGLDFETSNKRFSGSLSYYQKKSTDLFGNAPVDYTTVPVKALTINIANMKSSGIDANINALLIDKHLKWRSILLFNYSKTKVTRYYNTSTRGRDYVNNGSKITALEGYPLYSILSFQWAGLDSTGDPVGIVDKERSTNYTSITGSLTQVADLKYDGPATAPFFGSLIHSVSWRRFEISTAILYKLGYYFRKESINYDILFNQHEGNIDYANRWQKPGDESKTFVPAMAYPNNSNRDFFYTNSSVLVRKADHLRLQYVNISYDWLNKNDHLPFDQLRLYVVGSNLGLLWHANKENIDPDYGLSMPPEKSFSVGIKAMF